MSIRPCTILFRPYKVVVEYKNNLLYHYLCKSSNRAIQQYDFYINEIEFIFDKKFSELPITLNDESTFSKELIKIRLAEGR